MAVLFLLLRPIAQLSLLLLLLSSSNANASLAFVASPRLTTNHRASPIQASESGGDHHQLLSETTIQRLHHDYRALREALSYQAKFFSQLDADDPQEEELEKAAYQMVLKRFEQEREAREAAEELDEKVQELHHAKTRL